MINIDNQSINNAQRNNRNEGADPYCCDCKVKHIRIRKWPKGMVVPFHDQSSAV